MKIKNKDDLRVMQNTKNIYLVSEVFTPTLPARSTFVERPTVTNLLVSALRTPGKQIVLYGHSGSGKTTILVNKLEQYYDKRFIRTHCMDGMLFEQIISDAFDQLEPFFISERSSGKSGSLSTEILTEYFNIRGEVAREATSTHQRVLPPQLTPQTLGRFLGEARYCWVLEDFHKVAEAEKSKLSQLMKVFMDLADRFKELKIIAIGAVDTARQVVKYDLEMKNRVVEIRVPLMSDEEIQKILETGEQLLNLKIEKAVKSTIVYYSNGLAAVCHQLGLNMCAVLELNSTSVLKKNITKQDCEVAVQTYLQMNNDSLKEAFDKALNEGKKVTYQNHALVLGALAELPPDGAVKSDLHKRIKLRQPKYPPGNLNKALERLLSKDRASLVRFDSASSRYSFSDPLYRFYACATLMPKQDTDQQAKYIDPTTHEIMMDILGQFRTLLEKYGNGGN